MADKKSHAIPRKLGSMNDLEVRFKKAKARKETWINHLRECYEYTLPQRETFHLYSPGQKKNTTIYDDTAVIGLQKFASRIQAVIVPPWRKWSNFVPGSDIPEEKREGLQKGLDKVSDVVFDHINHSNFDTQANECFLDTGIGTGALVCNEGEGENLLDFQSVPLAEIYLEEGPNGTVETVFREHKIQLRYIKRLWPGAILSSKMEAQLQKDPTAMVDLVEGSVYCPETKLYHTLVLSLGEKHLAYRDDNETSAWVVPRWSTVPGEVYGRGPVMSVLPTIKTVNKVVEFTLRNAALAIAGVYTGADDGVLNPYTVTIAPGAVIPVDSNANNNPSLRPLDRAGDFNVSELILADLRESIKTALFNSQRTAEGPIKSATEIALDNKELVEDIGASFGRLQTEFVERVLKRVVDILTRAGKIPELKVDGKEVTIKHTSPLARAQDNEDLITFQTFLEALAPFGPEVTAMGVKIEEVPSYLAEKLGVETKIIRDDVEREQLKAKVAEVVANQQLAAQAEGQQ